MVLAALKSKAEYLESILSQYSATNAEAETLLRSLTPIFRLINWGVVEAPYDFSSIPGGYLFAEGSLRSIPELSQAYASFKIELAGLADSPVLTALKASGPPR